MANVSGPLHFKPYKKIENFSNEAVAVLSEGSLFITWPVEWMQYAFSSLEEQHLRHCAEHFLQFVCDCPKLDTCPCVNREDRSSCFFYNCSIIGSELAHTVASRFCFVAFYVRTHRNTATVHSQENRALVQVAKEVQFILQPFATSNRFIFGSKSKHRLINWQKQMQTSSSWCTWTPCLSWPPKEAKSNVASSTLDLFFWLHQMVPSQKCAKVLNFVAVSRKFGKTRWILVRIIFPGGYGRHSAPKSSEVFCHFWFCLKVFPWNSFCALNILKFFKLFTWEHAAPVEVSAAADSTSTYFYEKTLRLWQDFAKRAWLTGAFCLLITLRPPQT